MSTAITDALRATALLADVTVTMWGCEKSDRKLMEEVKGTHGATGNVGRVVKNLLSGADGAYKDTRSAFQACRSLHYNLTLPWTSAGLDQRASGPRMLATLLFDEYLGKMAVARREAMQSLDKFLDEYPDAIEKARANLGTLVTKADYPTPDEIRAQFSIKIDFNPLPAGKDYKGLPDITLEKLSKQLEKKTQAQVENVRKAMFDEVRDRIGRLAERLGDPEAMFKESTIVNAAELIGLLKGWNIMGDERAAEIASDLNRMTGGLDAKTLRNKADVRKDIAEQAAGIIEKLDAWGV